MNCPVLKGEDSCIILLYEKEGKKKKRKDQTKELPDIKNAIDEANPHAAPVGNPKSISHGRQIRHGQITHIGNKHMMHRHVIRQKHGAVTPKRHTKHVDIGGGIKQCMIPVVTAYEQIPKIPSNNDIS